MRKNHFFYESKLLSLNIKKAKKELGWSPTLSFIDTIRFTSIWYENFLKNKDLEKITETQIKLLRLKSKSTKIF